MTTTPKSLILSITLPPHQAGYTSSISNSREICHHPILRYPYEISQASSSAIRPMWSVVKLPHKRPRHDPDSESDGNDTDAESANTEDEAAVERGLKRFKTAYGLRRSIPRSTESTELATTSPVPGDAAEEVISPLPSAGDLLVEFLAPLRGGFTANQAKWAKTMVEALLSGAQFYTSTLLEKYCEIAGENVQIEAVPRISLAEEPVVIAVAAGGVWLGRDDSGEASGADMREFINILGQLQWRIAYSREVEKVLASQSPVPNVQSAVSDVKSVCTIASEPNTPIVSEHATTPNEEDARWALDESMYEISVSTWEKIREDNKGKRMDWSTAEEAKTYKTARKQEKMAKQQNIEKRKAERLAASEAKKQEKETAKQAKEDAKMTK